MLNAYSSSRHIHDALRPAGQECRTLVEIFSQAFYCNPAMMAVVNPENHTIVKANKAFLNLTGYSEKEIMGVPLPASGFWTNPEDYANLLTGLAESPAGINMEIKYGKKTGEAVVGLLSGDILTVNGREFLLLVIYDISQRVISEKETARIDRLNLISQIAAGMAHEIRNPLTTVRSFLQLLGLNEIFSEQREYFTLMINELDRANTIITQFLSLSREKEFSMSRMNLNSIIHDLYPPLEAEAAKEGKTVGLELAEIPDLELFDKDIHQLILNLAQNGLEAMQQGGILTIRTSCRNEDIILSVEDQGSGIDETVSHKIGSPFFTTKPLGTGLGLPLCYSIAARHKAQIHYDTGEQGTTFYVTFKNPQSQS